MSVTRIATRYAKSLIELAIEQNKLEAVHEDVNTLLAATKNRDFYLLLKSPVIANDKKHAILDAIFNGKIDPLTMAYAKLLVSKNREAFLPEIAAEFVEQYKTFKHITSVRVITATPLDASVVDALRAQILASKLTHESLDIETKVDPSLVGGFVLEFDNKRYDASVAYKLDTLRNQFSKNLYIKEF